VDRLNAYQNSLLSRRSLTHAAATPTTRLAGRALDEGDVRLAQPEQLVDCMVDLTLDSGDVAVPTHAGVRRQSTDAVGRQSDALTNQVAETLAGCTLRSRLRVRQTNGQLTEVLLGAGNPSATETVADLPEVPE